MGTGFARKKKEQKQYQEQLMRMQQTISQNLEGLEAEGSAGNGLVKVILAGTGEMKKIHLLKECIDPEDPEGLEVLIKSAYNNAFRQLQDVAGTLPKTMMSL